MWTAIILAALVAGGTLGYVAWAHHAVAHGAPLWAYIVGYPFAYLAVPLLFTICWFLLAWWFRAERPEDVRLSLRARAAMFVREFLALSRSGARMIFYRWLMPDPPAAPAKLPILLLHGVGCNAGVWSGFRRHLAECGIGPVYALSYGPPLASIDHFADQVADRLAGIEAATGAAQAVLVCHSMGGLVARAYLRKYGGGHVRRPLGAEGEGLAPPPRRRRGREPPDRRELQRQSRLGAGGAGLARADACSVERRTGGLGTELRGA